jgi:hypothetical protein
VLGAPDTILDGAGRKGALGHEAGNEILSDAPQIPLGAVLGDVTGDAINLIVLEFKESISISLFLIVDSKIRLQNSE